jgi:hypothetical protein
VDVRDANDDEAVLAVPELLGVLGGVVAVSCATGTRT